MKITRVIATPLSVPVTLDAAGLEKKTSLSACLVQVDTDPVSYTHLTLPTNREV